LDRPFRAPGDPFPRNAFRNRPIYNVASGKNLVGTFYQPRLVIVDTQTLESLPDREFYEGFAEVIKHAAIRDASLFAELEAFQRGDPITDILAKSIEIKASIVTADERESIGVRALLNFGHTLGHAIEQAAGYGAFFHGEAVALGMRAAAFLSRKHAKLTEREEQRLTSLIRHFHLPSILPERISTEDILKAVALDKKFSAGAIRFVLLDFIGNAFLSSQVTYADLEEAIQSLRA
ncbi:MAG: 3-dehydroquinate synthase family protein, partial [Verrucomicrobiia bacterium]